MALAFIVSVLGGLILAASSVARLPVVVVGLGSLLFVLGLALAFALGYRHSRRESGSFFGAIGRGLRTLWSGLWAFMP